MSAPFKVVFAGKRSLRWREIRNWDSEQAWISGPHHNGDWAYWLVLRIQYMREITGEEDAPTYYGEIAVVSPEAAGPDNLEAAVASCGYPTEDSEADLDPEVQAELLLDYGVYASVVQHQGENKRKAIQCLKDQAEGVQGLFGFYMDTRQNAIGATGWDFVAGNPLAPLNNREPESV